MTFPRSIRIGLGAIVFCASSAGAADIVTAPQGGVARWAGLAASDCGVYGKRYPAVDSVCYYPVDIRTRPGTHEIALWDQDGKQHLGTLRVEKAEFPQVEMELPESLDRFLDPSAEETKRAVAERAEIGKILGGSMEPAQFSLPLGSPAATLPASADDFGSERLFNKEHRSLHSGRDYPVSLGSPVKAVADGTVVLAAEHFFAGNSVFIDHGAGLVSMVFHLDSIAVKQGDAVKRGQTIGKVGSTGRATGPHLHIGLRWLGKRVDPALLLNNPNELPSVSDTRAEAQRKIDKAEQREPDEGEMPADEED
ncbi:MAG: M23 family metallopeptidase [Dokdonella sp.]|nr:M23 family metallopeptidase [Dokdonella sp.]MCB1570770.1 M23 family metallopeptidase [Xanthomonadales bacterium]MCB1572751.1 M23 family metallopeptidase [Xanthomonadales bacterium]MCB1576641.1 M23 family metallopeptidase [Xanthomonadales bacterium]